MTSKKKAPAKAARKTARAKKTAATKKTAAATKSSAQKKSSAKKSAAKKSAAKKSAAPGKAPQTRAAAKPKPAPPPPPPVKILFQDDCNGFRNWTRRIEAPAQRFTSSQWQASGGVFSCRELYNLATVYLTLASGFFVPANTRIQLRCKLGWTLGYNDLMKHGERFRVRVFSDRQSTFVVKADGDSSAFKSRVIDLPPVAAPTLYKLEFSLYSNFNVLGQASCAVGDIKVVAVPT